MEQYQGIVGLFVLIGIAWSCCENRKAIQWRHVAAGLALQAALAVLLVRLPVSQSVFIWLNRAVLALEQATTAGTTLVFGYLGGGLLQPLFRLRLYCQGVLFQRFCGLDHRVVQLFHRG